MFGLDMGSSGQSGSKDHHTFQSNLPIFSTIDPANWRDSKIQQKITLVQKKTCVMVSLLQHGL